MNYLVIFGSAAVPLIVGMIWYNPKVLGNAWMAAAGLTEERAKGINMPLVFGLTYLFGLFLVMSLMGITIHQMGVYSVVEGGKTPEEVAWYADAMAKYGNNFRTFKHGALHGTIISLFFALPVLGVSALFERRGAKYIFIHLGYWVISLAIMGGIICGYLDLVSMFSK